MQNFSKGALPLAVVRHRSHKKPSSVSLIIVLDFSHLICHVMSKMRKQLHSQRYSSSLSGFEPHPFDLQGFGRWGQDNPMVEDCGSDVRPTRVHTEL